MPTVYVHIGMEKTGTSALQYFLVHNRAVLREHGAVYPQFDLKYDWVNPDINGFWLMHPEDGFGPGRPCIRRINSLAKQFDTVILSAECLWNRQGFRPEFWQELKGCLDPGIQVKLLAYVRRQDQYVFSHWSQQVRSQRPGTIEKNPFPECIAGGGYRDNRLDYRAYFEDLIPVLGKDNILVRVYERSAFKDGSLYADFLDAVGLQLDDSYRQPEGLRYESMKGSVLETKRLLNGIPEFTGDEYLIAPYLMQVQRQMAQKGELPERDCFPRKERENFLQRFQESNAWLARTLLGREDGVLFLEPVADDDALAGTDYTAQEIADVCAGVLAGLTQENKELKERLKEKEMSEQAITETRGELEKISKKVIVSLTSYPARIAYVSAVLETIFAQTYPADEIVLWLADSEFPQKEEELPEDLRAMIDEGKVTLKWCKDLKPHKKYFYAFLEYPQDLIVTIDDDALYVPEFLEQLVASYLRHPHAVSAGRVHLMAITEDGTLLPYQLWVKDTDALVDRPCMQLFPTGVGGVLYPAELFKDSPMLSEEAVESTCLFADDVWLKAMELVHGVPVVAANPYRMLNNVPGSQDTSLYFKNADQGENDVYLSRVMEWLNEHVERDVFQKGMTASAEGCCELGIEAICRHMASERANSVKRQSVLLERSYEKRKESVEKLTKQREYYADRLRNSEEKRRNLEEKRDELKERVQKVQEQKAELNKKLQKTYEEKAERGERIKELEQQVYDLQHPLKKAAKKVSGKDKKE